MEILPCLNETDVFNFAMTCKEMHAVVKDDYSWQLLCKRRFSNFKLEDGESYLDAYKRLCCRLISFTTFNITWLDGRYWDIVDADVEDSLFRKVADLSMVCWFDVRKTIQSVAQGDYQVIYRLKLDSQARSFQQCTFSAIPLKPADSITVDAMASGFNDDQQAFVDDMENASILQTSSVFSEIEGCGYQLIGNMQDVLRVSLPFQDVKIELIDHSGLWKGPMALDCVYLHRVCDGKLLDSKEDLYAAFENYQRKVIPGANQVLPPQRQESSPLTVAEQTLAPNDSEEQPRCLIT
ncbi:hypothetical protein MP228_012369 [Amoeboaphelidium protococcarum]|nr:hypothetical protein MP228_012369 [Amoeboaphelidium protococcarum]